MEIEKTFDASQTIQFFKLERAVENLPMVAILTSSLYRNMGLATSKEDTTNEWAEKFYEELEKDTQLGNIFTDLELKKLFSSSLSVPISDKQSKLKKFWISPLVPEIGNYGLAARNTGQPWNPGKFIIEIIANYSSNLDEFLEVINGLNKALDINISEDLDLWSLCVKNEFETISAKLGVEPKEPFNEDNFIEFYNKNDRKKNLIHLSVFSKIAIQDLKNIIELKKNLTRQKWIGVLEGFLRITLFNHIIYTINLSKNYFFLIQSKLKASSLKIEELDINNFFNLTFSIENRIKIGTLRKDFIRSNVEDFGYYNALIYSILEKTDHSSFEDFADIKGFITTTEKILANFKNWETLHKFKINFQDIHELDLLKINENYSSLNNIKECLGYLCSRKISSSLKFVSDVNYIFDKIGISANSPYHFKLSPGLISTLTSLIFLRGDKTSSFISGLEFIQELSNYNIELTIRDISEGAIKDTMLSLGIIIDSPDTEGGVLIIKPGWIK